MKIIVNKLASHYETQGKGPVILFLHGWGDNEATFAPLVKNLKENYTCITVDLPGFGITEPPELTWGIKDYAEFVSKFIEKLSVQPKVVVGHSNGGTIAMYGVSHGLISPQRLILLASAGIRNQDAVRKKAYKIIAKSGKAASSWLPSSWQLRLKKKLYSSAGSDIFVSPHLEETFKKVVSYDVQVDVKNISIPTLIMYGDKDTATPPEFGEKLNKLIPDSKLVIVHGADHFIHQTQTKLVLEEVRGFLI